jgi:hypothetical protein
MSNCQMSHAHLSARYGASSTAARLRSSGSTLSTTPGMAARALSTQSLLIRKRSYVPGCMIGIKAVS